VQTPLARRGFVFTRWLWPTPHCIGGESLSPMLSAPRGPEPNAPRSVPIPTGSPSRFRMGLRRLGHLLTAQKFHGSNPRRDVGVMDLVRGNSPVVGACVRPLAAGPAAVRCAICGRPQRRRLARGLKLAGDGDHELLLRPDGRRRNARALRGAAPERRVAPSHARRDPAVAAAPRPEEPTEETPPARSVERGLRNRRSEVRILSAEGTLLRVADRLRVLGQVV